MNHLSELLAINKKYNKSNINIRNEHFNYINTIMDEFYRNKFKLDEFLSISATLFNSQIFTDGNSRTIFEYMVNTLENNDYTIDFDNIEKDYKYIRTFFPVMYELSSVLEQPEIIKMKKYIKKKPIQK